MRRRERWSRSLARCATACWAPGSRPPTYPTSASSRPCTAAPCRLPLPLLMEEVRTAATEVPRRPRWRSSTCPPSSSPFALVSVGLGPNFANLREKREGFNKNEDLLHTYSRNNINNTINLVNFEAKGISLITSLADFYLFTLVTLKITLAPFSIFKVPLGGSAFLYPAPGYLKFSQALNF